jgi:hypothetical protein
MRIGLIALSGVRACDAELMEIGLTFPGVVERSQVIAALPSLGLLTLAGMTPPGHGCRYIEVQDIRNSGELPTDFDLVAISSLRRSLKRTSWLIGFVPPAYRWCSADCT